ncbi:MAG: SH3 domain-containing protein [Omnitrophica bacterium]|nr:SH3 domain-containing protein [Candidatus Omnitrophota bacterium]
MKKILVFALIISVYLPAAFSSSIYLVVKDKINVRVDSTVQSDSLGLLPKGVTVEELEKRYNWVKIRLPRNFTCYVSRQFIERIPGNKGRVIASSLNLRNKASLESYSIGKIAKGTVVPILGRTKDWYKIRAYPYVHGWVHAKFLKKSEKKLNLNVLVKGLVSELSESNISKKSRVHKKLIEKGEIIVPLLEVYLHTADKNTIYSLILVLSSIGESNPKLVSYFLRKAEPSLGRLAGAYLDVAQNIIQPPGEKNAYFYQAQQGKLTSDQISSARLRLQKAHIKNKR